MSDAHTREAKMLPLLCDLKLAASVLVLVGFFGPWVAHASAALTVTGYEMSEFAKFFPQVQSGVVPVRRAFFVTPLLSAVISAALVLGRSRRRLLCRVGATGVAALLSLAVLPPHQAILEPAYRLQLVVVAAGILLTAATLLTRRLSERLSGLLTLVVALSGAIPALWQYVLLRPLVSDLYGAQILPGWGLFICVIGLVLLSMTGLREIFTA